MDDAVVVGVVEGAGDLAKNADAFVDRELALAGEPRAQRLTLDVRHREIRNAPGVAGVQQRNDVRVLETRGEGDLALESLDGHAGRHLRREHLDDHAPAERCLLGHEDPGHPSPAQLTLDRVCAAQGRLQTLAHRTRLTAAAFPWRTPCRPRHATRRSSGDPFPA